MQFTCVGYDENGIISFVLDGQEGRQYNPFLTACQGMLGSRILEDYTTDCQNLVPRYVPIRYLLDAQTTPDMERAVLWLENHAVREQDKYYWPYPYPATYGNQHLEKGWVSAFGQAYAALAMLLFYLKTKEDKYRAYAAGAIRGMTTGQAQGGCAQVLGEGQLWFEEIPGEGATHIFNAHLIGMIAIAQLREYLGITEFDRCYAQAFYAFKKQLSWMDTGIMSAYDRPRELSFQLQLDSEDFGNDVYIGAVSVEDGTKTVTVDLSSDACFTDGGCYASGIDWSAQLDENGYRRIVDGRSIRKENAPQGTLQNTYLTFRHISTEEELLKLTITYSAGRDTRLVLKKNCGERGFQEIGLHGNIMLLGKEKRKTLCIPTRCLLPDLSMAYHKYHMVLLEELLHIQYDAAVSKLLQRFESYGNQTRPSVPRAELESLSVCVNTNCGLACKMCDIGIQNKDASLYKNLQGGGQNENLDADLLIKRCRECASTLHTVHFVGTEPTLYKDLPKAVREIKKLGKQVLVTTNGINLENMLVPLLHAGVDQILISIDGPGRIHDEIRGRQGLFCSIMEVLEAQKEELAKARGRGAEIVACCAVTPVNYRYLPEMVQELAGHGIKGIWCTHMNYVDARTADLHNACHSDYPIGRSCIHADMEPKKVNPWIMSESIKAARKTAEQFHMEFAEAPQMFGVEDYEKLYHRPKAVVGQPVCTAPFRTMQVNADGSVCVMSRCYQLEIGNIREHTLMELFYSSGLDDFRKKIMEQAQWEPCKRCCAIM